MEFHFELGDDAEVAATSAQGPKQVRVFARARMHKGTVGSHHRQAFDVVARQAVQASEPAKSSAQNQPGGAGVRDYSGGKNQAVFLRSRIDRAEQTAAGKAGFAAFGVDRYLTHC